MRPISRRRFIKLLTLFASGTGLAGFSTFSSANELKNKSFTKNYSKFIIDYWNQYLIWHNKTFFNLNKHLNKYDHKFIDDCIKSSVSMIYKVNSDFIYSNASFSHRIKNNDINSSRFYFGNVQNPEIIRESALNLLKHRGISSKIAPSIKDTLVGIGWDVKADHLKIYTYYNDINNITDSDIKSLRNMAAETSCYKTGLAGYIFKGKDLLEKKIYIACQERVPEKANSVPFKNNVLFTNYMITSKRGIVPQLDLDPSVNKDNIDINKAGKKIAKIYFEKWKSNIDTITYTNKNDYTLYFPS